MPDRTYTPNPSVSRALLLPNMTPSAAEGCIHALPCLPGISYQPCICLILNHRSVYILKSLSMMCDCGCLSLSRSLKLFLLLSVHSCKFEAICLAFCMTYCENRGVLTNQSTRNTKSLRHASQLCALVVSGHRETLPGALLSRSASTRSSKNKSETQLNQDAAFTRSMAKSQALCFRAMALTGRQWHVQVGLTDAT